MRREARIFALAAAMLGADRVAAQPVASVLAVETFDSAWTRIARSHYDTTFGGMDWNAVRAELRPIAAEARTMPELRAVLGDMLGRIGDSHYGLIPREISDAVAPSAPAGDVAGTAGMELRVADGRVVVWRVEPDGAAAAAGVRAGWEVERIGERRPGEEQARLEALGGQSEGRIARTQFLRSVNVALDGPIGSTIEVGLRDGANAPVTLAIERRERDGRIIRFGNLPPLPAELHHSRIESGVRCVGVIRFNVWMVPLAPEFDGAVDALRDCAGIVIDVRGNPGGVAGMVMGVAGHFFAEPEPLGILQMRGTELRLIANPRTVDASGEPVKPYAGRVAVLTDALTVSTSEIFAAAMQVSGRARLFGETTAGQALPATAARLPNGDVLMHVVADLTAPDGSRIEGRGVRPDVAVPVRRTDLLAGRDAPLDTAVRWILDGADGASRPGRARPANETTGVEE